MAPTSDASTAGKPLNSGNRGSTANTQLSAAISSNSSTSTKEDRAATNDSDSPAGTPPPPPSAFTGNATKATLVRHSVAQLRYFNGECNILLPKVALCTTAAVRIEPKAIAASF